jgi:FkbM family methyltransferase
VLQRAKRVLEASFGVRIYRHSLPRGVDVAHDLARFLRREEIRTVFDVGANVGQSAIAFASRFPRAEIYCLEPIAATFQRLVENTRHLSRVHALRLGLGDSDSRLEMFVDPDSRLNTLVEWRDTSGMPRESIEVRRLDGLVKELGLPSIDYLKIDAEGYDLKVLHGAKATLDGGGVKLVQVECDFGESGSRYVAFDRIKEWLDSAGFALFGVYDQTRFWDGRPWIEYCNAVFMNRDLFPASRKR